MKDKQELKDGYYWYCVTPNGLEEANSFIPAGEKKITGEPILVYIRGEELDYVDEPNPHVDVDCMAEGKFIKIEPPTEEKESKYVDAVMGLAVAQGEHDKEKDKCWEKAAKILEDSVEKLKGKQGGTKMTKTKQALIDLFEIVLMIADELGEEGRMETVKTYDTFCKTINKFEQEIREEKEEPLTHKELKAKALDTDRKKELYEKYRKESLELDKLNKPRGDRNNGTAKSKNG